MRRLIIGTLSLALPGLAGADLVNTALVSYRDPAGTARTGQSNAVTVVVTTSVDPPPRHLPAPELKLPAVMRVTDEIVLDYPVQVDGFNWTIERTASPAFAKASAGKGWSISRAGAPQAIATASPRLSLAAANLTPGTYLITVEAVNGSQVSPKGSAYVTLVSADLTGFRVFPNPWRADRGHQRITFDQLSAGCTVKIFTLSGHWIKTLDAAAGQATWDLTNDAGERVASGLYLYLITDTLGNKASGKIAVIR